MLFLLLVNFCPFYFLYYMWCPPFSSTGYQSIASNFPYPILNYFDKLMTECVLPRRTWLMHRPSFIKVNTLIKDADELLSQLNSIPLSSIVIGTFFCLESFLVKKVCFVRIWMQLGFSKLSVLVLWTNLLFLGLLSRKWLSRYVSLIVIDLSIDLLIDLLIDILIDWLIEKAL